MVTAGGPSYHPLLEMDAAQVRDALGDHAGLDLEVARSAVGRMRPGGSLVFDDTYEHEAWNETDETRVVLFVDVIRPLRQPMRSLNAGIIKAIGYSPFIQDAKRRHREWEQRFEREAG